MIEIQNYIDGELVGPSGNRYLANVEPATGIVFSKVPDSDGGDVDRAVRAAERAFHDWSRTPVEERSRILLGLADKLECRLEKFARAESVDTGKPLALARSVDIPRAVRNLRFFATAVVHFRSEAHPTDYTAINYTLRRPRGVAGLISPWNLPLYLLTWKVAPAVAAGNTAVAKPSELTPMTAFMFSELAIEAGIPPGVLNIVHGRGASAGEAIVSHPTVGTISFTGGTATGSRIAALSAPMFKKLALELGGKNPNIVFADADLDDALDGSVRASFANQGQICLCGSRLFVERPVYQDFLERLVERARALEIGDPLEDKTQQGALVSRAHFDKVMGYIDLAREEGGTICCGGGRPPELPARCKDGYFIEPTVVADLPPDCRTNQEEVFGPFVTITPFETEDQALQFANSTPYGLSASIWTQDVSRAHRVAEGLESGTVWVNCWLVRDLRVPFGGMKQSGVGREGGEEALRFFTEAKNVCIQVPGLGGESPDTKGEPS